uniref:Uncharacterized protein n=1 Tax=Anguilla anguilla TaxID=7936 RepID=A0A0E9X7I6_ANGAN
MFEVCCVAFTIKLINIFTFITIQSNFIMGYAAYLYTFYLPHTQRFAWNKVSIQPEWPVSLQDPEQSTYSKCMDVMSALIQ